MTDQAPSRKERDKLLREEDFLNAGERLFAERGYFETSMEDVAREAEYATGTIYRYFASKEELYQRLLLRKGLAYSVEMEAMLADAGTPLEQLRALVTGKVHFFFANRAFMRIFLHEVSRPAHRSPCQLPGDLQKMHESYLDKLREIFRAGMEEGAFRVLDVEMALAAITGMINELLMASLDEQYAHSEEEVAAFIFEFLQGGLIKKRGRA